MARTVPPSFVEIGPKLRVVAPLKWEWQKTAKTGVIPKKNSVSEPGVIFWGSTLFLAVFGHRRVRGATTLNFGLISTKLGGIVRAIKKMT